jgi:D-psicose/D-tagatose/L-ribulose 3-epimerase
MRLGVSTLVWSERFDPAVIPFDKLKKAEIEGLEIPLADPKDLNTKKLKETLKENKLSCTLAVSNPPGLNAISSDPKVRSSTLKHWKKLIEIAAEVECELLAGPSYAPAGYLTGQRRTSDEWDRAVEFHQKMAPLLSEHGIRLAVEPLNRFQTHFLNTAEDAVKFVDGVGSPHIGIVLDTFHSNIEDKNIAVACRLCGKQRLFHVQAAENDRGTPGSGHLDWPGVLRILREMGYDGWLMIESLSGTVESVSKAASVWRDLAPSEDYVAVHGTAFLKKLWAAV